MHGLRSWSVRRFWCKRLHQLRSRYLWPDDKRFAVPQLLSGNLLSGHIDFLHRLHQRAVPSKHRADCMLSLHCGLLLCGHCFWVHILRGW